MIAPSSRNFNTDPDYMDYLLNQFNQLIAKINQINFIHMGGCGIAAYTMYRWLQKYGLLAGDFKFVFLYSNTYQYEHNGAILKGESNDGFLVPTHIIIFNNGKPMDVNGLVELNTDLKEEKEGIHFVTNPNILLDMINKPGGDGKWYHHWNDMFDRENSVHLIAHLSGISLDEIKTTKF